MTWRSKPESIAIEKQQRAKNRRTWYGPTATVVIGPGFLHRAGFGWLLIPHPPLANWFLRHGMRDTDGQALALVHEFGHLQTLPLVASYLAVNLALAAVRGNFNRPIVLFLFVSAHAAWEMMAEGYTMASGGRFYRQCYQGTSRLPRWIFWPVAAVLSLAGWIVAV